MSRERRIRPLFLAVFVLALVAASIAGVYLLMPQEGLMVPPPEVPEPVYKPKPEPDPVPHDQLLTRGTALYSQFYEELVIRHFFEDRKGGVFVDVGCAWPIKNSTTFYLEHHLDWTGIAIDAQESFRELWEADRPNTKFFSYAVTDQDGERVTFYLAPVKGVSSLSPDHIQRWRGGKPEKTEVETITLDTLLDDNGISRFDFLSMDIEGAELLALEGFDIERFQPSLVCIEAVNVEDRDKLLEYFLIHGYKRIERYLEFDKINWYFTPDEETAEEETAEITEEGP
ncbi:MAG: FkbM family methyltransferase [Candidatus Hydrogenedentota bacterium]